jgi:hypothetical protein
MTMWPASVAGACGVGINCVLIASGIHAHELLADGALQGEVLQGIKRSRLCA